MRQSIGTTFMLNFIILFIFLVFAFLAGTLSYYKAYRVNNSIVNAIERFEGYNQYSIEEINTRLAGLAYETANLRNDISAYCPQEWKESVPASKTNLNYYVTGTLVTNTEGRGEMGYCVYYFENDNNFDAKSGNIETTDNYYMYGVLTYIQFKFPGFQYLLRIPVFSRTNRMYAFN